MIDLQYRQLQPELMDDPSLPRAEHNQALRGLERIHRFTGTIGRLWRAISAELPPAAGSMSIMDVGCGDGLALRSFARLAAREGREVRLIGCDFSSQALRMAEEAATADGVSLELHQVDVLEQPLPVPADVVICSLFLHHFQDPQVLHILRSFQSSARRAVVIEDLVRSRMGLLLCNIGVRLFSRSRIVHVDGPLSVRAGFTLGEMTRLVQEAGMSQARVAKRWPERLLVQWRKGDSHVAN